MSNDIPISTIVKVTITTTPTWPTRRGFGTANIVGISDVIPASERFRFYANMEGVAEDFNSTDEEYQQALAYFSQQPPPDRLMISRRLNVDVAAELRGSTVISLLSVFTAIADGSFNITIDGDPQDITGLDFTTGVTSYNDVASVIQAALQAIGTGGYIASTCIHNGSRFVIRSGTTGASSTITVLSAAAGGTNISVNLGMDAANGTADNGYDADATIQDSLDAIEGASNDWYGLLFTKEVRDGTDVQDAASWVEARIKVFVTTSNDANALDSGATSDIIYALKQQNFRRTMSIYHATVDEYPDASIMARAFIVNFNQPNSTITLNLKQMPAITTNALTVNKLNTLKGKNGNALISFDGNPAFSDGRMANSHWFDEVHGIDWLQNAIENNVFGALYTSSTKIPYTDKGAAILQNQVELALDEGVRNGLLAPGTTTLTKEFLPKGYDTAVVPVADVPQAQKEARIGPNITFRAIGAGAIHGIEVDGVFQR